MRIVWDDVCPGVGRAGVMKLDEQSCPVAIVKAMSLGLTCVPYPPLTVMEADKLVCCCLRKESKRCRICSCIQIGKLWEECRNKWIEFADSAGVDIRPSFIEMEKLSLSSLLKSNSVTEVFIVGRRMEQMRLLLGEPCHHQLESDATGLFYL